MIPVLGVWLAILGVSCSAAALAPPPQRSLRAHSRAITMLLCAGGLAGLVAVGLGMTGQMAAGALGAMAACGFVLPCLWLIRAPETGGDGDDDDDDDGGQPRAPKPPAPSAPGGPPGPDWQSFDDMRAGWERAGRDREPVAP